MCMTCHRIYLCPHDVYNVFLQTSCTTTCTASPDIQYVVHRTKLLHLNDTRGIEASWTYLAFGNKGRWSTHLSRVVPLRNHRPPSMLWKEWGQDDFGTTRLTVRRAGTSHSPERFSAKGMASPSSGLKWAKKMWSPCLQSKSPLAIVYHRAPKFLGKAAALYIYI